MMRMFGNYDHGGSEKNNIGIIIELFLLILSECQHGGKCCLILSKYGVDLGQGGVTFPSSKFVDALPL